MTKKELVQPVCQVCIDRGLWKNYCKPDDHSGCGFFAKIWLEQWEETCKLIRERTGKKK